MLVGEDSVKVTKTEKNEDPIVLQENVEQPIFEIPTEVFDLPSGGKWYPKDHPLAAGKIEMKYMTAKEEDILTNQSFIKSGVVLDKLFQSMIVTKFKYEDLLLGDRNAIMVAARKLSYGEIFKTKITTPDGNEQEEEINLNLLKFNTPAIIPDHKNEFTFTLPKSKIVLGFKVLNVGDERKIDIRLEQWKKMKRSGEVTARLREIITSVNGDTNPGHIASFIDNHFLSYDSRAFRDYVAEVTPNMDFELEFIDEVSGEPFRHTFTFEPRLFWPSARI